jgi:F-type H+-transporting ATPase subunit b
MLEFNPGLTFWATVTFLLLVFLLGRLAWKPILKALDEREGKIKEAIESAERAKREAEEISRKNQELVANMEKEAKQRYQEAIEKAQAERDKILAQATKQTELELSRAREEIQREKESALKELRDQVADLAIAAAGKIINASLDEARHRDLVNEFISNLPTEQN